MNQECINIRTLLLIELLKALKEKYNQLNDITSEISKLSGNSFKEVFHENIEDIKVETEKHKQNIEKIKQLNFEITAKINAWYEFVKNNNEIYRLGFPVKFFLRKRNLQKEIKKKNEEISNITIENRFVKEQLTVLTHKLEVNAIQKIKTGNNYQAYEKIISQKDMLVSELKYLIPTIPGLCPADIGINGIDSFIKKINSLIN